jgi:hypothetical protein
MRGGYSSFAHQISVSQPLRQWSQVHSPRDSHPPRYRAATFVAPGPTGHSLQLGRIARAATHSSMMLRQSYVRFTGLERIGGRSCLFQRTGPSLRQSGAAAGSRRGTRPRPTTANHPNVRRARPGPRPSPVLPHGHGPADREPRAAAPTAIIRHPTLSKSPSERAGTVGVEPGPPPLQPLFRMGNGVGLPAGVLGAVSVPAAGDARKLPACS